MGKYREGVFPTEAMHCRYYDEAAGAWSDRGVPAC